MRRLGSAAALLIVVAGGPSAARAHEGHDAALDLDRYSAGETASDDFALSRPVDLGHLQWDALIQLDYALNPLVYEADLGHSDTESAAVVEHHLVVHLGLALGLVDRLVLFTGIPLTGFMQGDNTIALLPEVEGSAIGDPFLGARLRLLGTPSESFALALQLRAAVPLGRAIDDEQSLAVSDTWSMHPEVLLDLGSPDLRITIDAGARLRGAEDGFDTLEVGHELTFGVGAAVPLVPKVTGHLQVFGSTDFSRFFERENTPLEALLGGKLQAGGGWSAGLGVGTGLTRGYGSPDFRGLLTIAHTSRWERPQPVPEAPADRDGDGLLDPDDRCPDEPEDADQFEDEDGCPDPDNDGDQVLDASDGAPNDPEDPDQFEDQDGIPDPDNDGDGKPDGDDRCPNEAEDVDQVADDDGCPEADADGDTVLDPQDRCPMTPGLANHSNPDCLGCPALACTDASGTIRILERVEFETDSDVLLPRSEPVLQAVQEILSTNTMIRKVRVEGHTDDRGNDQHNQELSQRRAQSVVRWLTEHGIDASRLEAQGLGETRPLVPNQGARNRQTNRRVEFHITDPAPPAEESPPAAGAGAPIPAAAPTPAAAPAPPAPPAQEGQP